MDKPNLKINLLPRLSEKSYGLSNSRVYVIDLDPNVNKLTVKNAVEAQFEVKIVKVNIVKVKGKAKRSVSKNGRRVSSGRDKAVKKAYVTLAEGYSLPFFEAIEEEQKKAEKVQAEVDKKQASDAKPKKRLSLRPKAKKEKS